MTANRDAPALGPPVALTLRVGTLLAVAGIGVGYLLEILTGESATGSIVELLAGGGAGALIGSDSGPHPHAACGSGGRGAFSRAVGSAVARSPRSWRSRSSSPASSPRRSSGGELTVLAGVGDTRLARRGVSPEVAIVRTAGRIPPGGTGRALRRSGETFGHLMTAPPGAVEAVIGG